MSGVTALLGPNGAGKSSLIKLACGVLRPSGGRVLLDGRPATRRELAARVGWVPQQGATIPGFTVAEQIAYAGWLKGLRRREAAAHAVAAAAAVRLGGLLDRPAATLSGGQLRRLGIAQALVHRAEILLLDEPTAGLDPDQRAGLREVIAATAAGGSALLIATHTVDDLDVLYDRVVVLNEGKILFDDSAAAFLAHGTGDHPLERAESA